MQPRAGHNFFRRRFLDAAWRLGCAGGYEAVKIRAIAEKVGASAALIYSYFEDKAALMAELRNIGAVRLEETLGERMPEQSAATLLWLSELYLAHMREYAWLFVDGLGLGAHEASARVFFPRAAALLVDDAVVRPPSESAAHLWIGLQGLLAASRHSPELLDAGTEREHLRLLLGALRELAPGGPRLVPALDID